MNYMQTVYTTMVHDLLLIPNGVCVDMRKYYEILDKHWCQVKGLDCKAMREYIESSTLLCELQNASE